MMTARVLCPLLQYTKMMRLNAKNLSPLACSTCQFRTIWNIYSLVNSGGKLTESRLLPPNFQVDSERHYSKKAKEKGKAKGKSKGVPNPEKQLSEEDLNALFSYEDMISEMTQPLENLKEYYFKELRLRTSSGILTDIDVHTDDGKFPLNQIAKVIQKTPQLVTVDATVSPQYVKNIGDAIRDSNMGLNPQQNGLSFAVPIPKVTREYREKLAKSSKTKANEMKLKVDNIMKKYEKILHKKHEHISEDTVRLLGIVVQMNSKKVKTGIEDLQKAKEKELLN